MRLAVANYSFEVLPLEATLMVCKSLGFKAVDIAGFHDRGHCSFEPEAIAANPQQQADILKTLVTFKAQLTRWSSPQKELPPVPWTLRSV